MRRGGACARKEEEQYRDADTERGRKQEPDESFFQRLYRVDYKDVAVGNDSRKDVRRCGQYCLRDVAELACRFPHEEECGEKEKGWKKFLHMFGARSERSFLSSASASGVCRCSCVRGLWSGTASFSRIVPERPST